MQQCNLHIIANIMVITESQVYVIGCFVLRVSRVLPDILCTEELGHIGRSLQHTIDASSGKM